jgi:hypothetical protein
MICGGGSDRAGRTAEVLDSANWVEGGRITPESYGEAGENVSTNRWIDINEVEVWM